MCEDYNKDKCDDGQCEYNFCKEQFSYESIVGFNKITAEDTRIEIKESQKIDTKNMSISELMLLVLLENKNLNTLIECIEDVNRSIT